MAQPKSNGWERILIFSDTHSVFLDRKAWNVFLKVCEDYKPDRVIGNGDIIDCVGISEHANKLSSHSPEVIDEFPFAYELDFTRKEILEPLRRAVGPKCKIELRLGNHEMRFIRPNRANATALSDILDTCVKRRATRLEDLLRLDSPKIRATLSYNASDTLYGTFTIIHGVKTNAGAAKANLLRYGSGTSGHSHRGNVAGQKMRGMQAGWWESCCLRKIENVEYLPHGDSPDWVQGFLSLTINKRTGKFFCKQHLIINGETEFNGKLY